MMIFPFNPEKFRAKIGLFPIPYFGCLNTEILHTVLTIKRLKWEQEMYLIASLALILNFEF